MKRPLIVLTAVLVLVGGYLAFWYVAAPRWGGLYESRSFAETGSREFTEVMYLRPGFGDAHLIGASPTSDKYSVVSWRVLPSATASRDQRVDDPSNTVRVSVMMHVNNCAARDDWVPVTLDLRRWWINRSETIIDHGVGFAGPYDACRNL